MTIKINKLITSILVNTTIKLEKRRESKDAKKKKNKNQNSPKPY
jgi:hypothetical protein